MGKPKRELKIILSLILLVAALFMLTFNMNFLKESPFSLRRVWDAPSYVTATSNERMIVVDKSKTRVSVTDAQQRITAAIYGGVTTEDGFYYAEYTATDGSSIYIADVTHQPNSNHVERERILRFSMNGKYLNTVWDVRYAAEEMPLQLGTVRGLRAYAGKVYFPRLCGSEFSLCTVDENGKYSSRLLKTLGERVCYAAYDPITHTTAFSTMQGSLIVDRDGATERFDYGNGMNVLQGVAVDNEGGVYTADLSDSSVISVKRHEAKALYTGDWIQFLSVSSRILGFHDLNKVCLASTDGSVIYSSESAPYAYMYALRLILTWISALYLALCAAVLLIYLVYISGKSDSTRQGLRAAAIIMLILLVTASAGGYIIYSLDKSMTESSMDELMRSALYLSSISSQTYGDAFSRLNELKDYDNEDYKRVRLFLDDFCKKSFETGLNTYYILLKFDVASDSLWGVMDYENTNGVVYPYYPYSESGYDYTGNTGRPLSVQNERTAFGLFSYVVVPVYDAKGAMAGLLEIGANTYSQQEARQKLVLQVAWTTFSALMMALLMYNEIVAYRKQLLIRGGKRSGESVAPVLGFVRPIVFLAFLGDNLDAAFVPQLSEALYSSGGSGANLTLAAALPMSAQLFAIAGASLLGGVAADRYSVKKLMLSGCVFRIFSSVIALFAVLRQSYALFIFAKLLGGFGSGALMVGCNILPSCTSNETERTELFAGLNIGVMSGVVLGAAIGGYTAQYVSRAACYAGAVAVMLLCALACVYYVGAEWKSAAGAAEERKRALRSFIKKPAVFGFLSFVLFPYMVMGYFKDYVFPLFASGLGHGEADIGNVLLISGILAIYLGGILPERLFKRLGVRVSMCLANIVYIGALLLFATQQSYEAAVAAVCVLALGSYGMTAQGVYIADVAEREHTPAGTAMGVYGFTDNMGQTCGPLILGALLPIGFGLAMGTVVAAGTALLFVFQILTRKDQSNGKK